MQNIHFWQLPLIMRSIFDSFPACLINKQNAWFLTSCNYVYRKYNLKTDPIEGTIVSGEISLFFNAVIINLEHFKTAVPGITGHLQ